MLKEIIVTWGSRWKNLICNYLGVIFLDGLCLTCLYKINLFILSKLFEIIYEKIANLQVVNFFLLVNFIFIILFKILFYFFI